MYTTAFQSLLEAQREGRSQATIARFEGTLTHLRLVTSISSTDLRTIESLALWGEAWAERKWSAPLKHLVHQKLLH